MKLKYNQMYLDYPSVRLQGLLGGRDNGAEVLPLEADGGISAWERARVRETVCQAARIQEAV